MAEKQVRINPIVHTKLEEIIKARKEQGYNYSKQGAVAQLILEAHKREVKK